MRSSSKQEVLDLLNRHRSDLRQLGETQCGVFGSFVRGESNDCSDVDILVDFAPGQKSFDHFMELSFLLEDLFGRKVDLVTTDSLSPHIGPHILREVEYASPGG
jgi:predicted nucleotidyltransferase